MWIVTLNDVVVGVYDTKANAKRAALVYKGVDSVVVEVLKKL